MRMSPPPRNLTDWLLLLESRHPREIELGLERVAHVASVLQLSPPAPLVISIAGTNGKGSCCAVLEAVLRQRRISVGVYTSPHLRRFNERICVDGAPVSDSELCACFAFIEAARGEVLLTYFEFTTLAALSLFSAHQVDVAILEVGLGGRLDAVNLVEADVAVITSIALDHEDWLGSDLNGIAAEKAGILRPGKPLVYGGDILYDSVAARVSELGCPLYQRGTEFSFAPDQQGWQWRGSDPGSKLQRICGTLPRPEVALDNVATALQTLLVAGLLPDDRQIGMALRGLSIAGRFQVLLYLNTTLVLDVAHNVAAAARLAEELKSQPVAGATVAVFAVMADKDSESMLRCLRAQVDQWIFAELPGVRRAASAISLCQTAAALGCRVDSGAADVAAALDRAQSLAGTDGRVLVCGSFLTVAAALERIEATGSTEESVP